MQRHGLACLRLRNYFKKYIPQVCEVLEPRGGGIRRGRTREISQRRGLAKRGRGGRSVMGLDEVGVG